MSVLEKISEYLQVGGFFNPELMEHDKVRDMILERRDEFKKLQEENKILKIACMFYSENCPSSDLSFCGDNPSNLLADEALKKIEELK